MGKLFPRSDRSPAIEPVAPAALRRLMAADASLAALAHRPHAAHRRRLLHLAGPGVDAHVNADHAALPRLAPRHAAWTQRRRRAFLPFADAASAELPLPRLLRLSLFQVSVGMATALLVGTLNRVMIVELDMAAWLVSLMVALPLLVAPFRAFVGHRSDTHASVTRLARVPYIWIGTLLQFGGLAIMPFALLVLTGEGQLGLAWVGHCLRGAGLPAGRRRPADHADRRPGAGHRPGARGHRARAWWR